MEIAFDKVAKNDLILEKPGNKAIQTKIQSLLNAIAASPFEEIGKPEP